MNPTDTKSALHLHSPLRRHIDPDPNPTPIPIPIPIPIPCLCAISAPLVAIKWENAVAMWMLMLVSAPDASKQITHKEWNRMKWATSHTWKNYTVCLSTKLS